MFISCKIPCKISCKIPWKYMDDDDWGVARHDETESWEHVGMTVDRWSCQVRLGRWAEMVAIDYPFHVKDREKVMALNNLWFTNDRGSSLNWPGFSSGCWSTYTHQSVKELLLVSVDLFISSLTQCPESVYCRCSAVFDMFYAILFKSNHPYSY